jgi:hypothetical protein
MLEHALVTTHWFAGLLIIVGAIHAALKTKDWPIGLTLVSASIVVAITLPYLVMIGLVLIALNWLAERFLATYP